jgi:Cys-rich repeat protein
MKTLATLSFLFASLVAACAVDPTTSSADRPIIETPCTADTDCPTGFECEIEVEHGVTTSYCQAHGDGDGTCPAGYELEIEHGQAFCKPHGGSGGGAGSGSGSGSGSDDNAGSPGTGTTGATCAADTDCAAGYECEIEVEHGQTTGTCKPHGGV